ncbi:hypothetical protein N7474_009158 [Penicillium riverlandense]|uniref:uncharacterized protein n=1 Tax=Penicillium riverlandense TaxID=1903569 RepID=UPI002548D5CD|nr:uncharacterized protein N7474_009158 [Penicillium riverlandense]KAJ5807889.1 hypothetical protein N7474_009158 [Penicillium riverlandense]
MSCWSPNTERASGIINAGSTTKRGELVNIVLDYITTTIISAIECQAAIEAQENYVGTYVSTVPSLNSSMTIAFNKSTTTTPNSGLSISEWISNGTDMLNSDLFLGLRPRLLPSILKQTPDREKGEVAFQASLMEQTNSYFGPGAAKDGAIGPFTGQYKTNNDSLVTDATHYGGKGTCLFVFEVDGDGGATAVSPAAARVKLERKE